MRSEVTKPLGRGVQSAAAAAPGPPGPSAPSCACRRWDSPGCGPGGRAEVRARSGAGAVPRTLAPVCCPPGARPSGAVCSAGPGGGGEPVTEGARAGQPYITWHLAWEPAPPTRSLGKARPALGEGAETLRVLLCDGVCVWPFPGRTGCPALPAQQPPSPAPGRLGRVYWPIVQAWTLRVRETLTAGRGCVGGNLGGCTGPAGRPPGADDVLVQAALAALALRPQA